MNPQNPVRGLTDFKSVEPSGLLIASVSIFAPHRNTRSAFSMRRILALLSVEKRTMRKANKSLKVDREKFEGVVRNLLQTKPVKRDDVKVKNPKNREKLIPPDRPEK